MNNVYAPQFEASDAIASSPQRGGIPNLLKPELYYSPIKKQGHGGLVDMPPGQGMQLGPQMMPHMVPQMMSEMTSPLMSKRKF